MEIAQWHPGLESTAECTHGQLGCSAVKLPLWRAPESSGLCENLSWVTDYVFCCLFVKPPYYLELGELTATLMGLRGWSLRNVRIREIKGKNPPPNCVLAWAVQLSPCLTWAKQRQKGQHRHSWAVAAAEHLQASLPVNQNEPKSCEIRYTQLCSALENSWLWLFEYALRNQTIT